MDEENPAEMDVEEVEEVLPTMWPENLGKEDDKKFNIDHPSPDQDMLEEVAIPEEPKIVDFQHLEELTSYTEQGSSQLSFLVNQWQARHENAFRLLSEQLEILNKQKHEAELKELQILEEHKFEGENRGGDKRPISILEDDYTFGENVPAAKKEFCYQNNFQMGIERDSIEYWKERSTKLELLLDASLERENKLQEKLQENLELLTKQSSPVEELSQILRRADNFLHFVLQNAPVVIGHQDKELRYRFIYNHFPSLDGKDIIGKTDVEIFTGAGVKESQDFKQEVLQRGLPAKREINFETDLFGVKTFLIYVEPVFNKAGETIGVNYMGMDITDQVAKREKLAKLREEKAVRNAMETELNKTIHITEETMRAKQMLATMSHEIRSPLSGVVSMAEILSNTRLEKDQKQLVDVMISSGDLVLQLINDILDLSKVESGVMKLEATNFRPREVIKHVLQTAAASLQKDLTLEGFISEDVPVEVVGDVLRIRQILTNLISNAIKFTHKGKVGITLRVTSQSHTENIKKEGKKTRSSYTHTEVDASMEQQKSLCHEGNSSNAKASHIISTKASSHQNDSANQCEKSRSLLVGDDNQKSNCDEEEKVVWLHCDVYDTGIGIPEKALPTLFKKYMQVSAAHARKYGGTGLGLAICKQLVELMGGNLTVKSQEHLGSTFSFTLPCKLPKEESSGDESDNDSLYDASHPDHEAAGSSIAEEVKESYFHFQPSKLSSLFSSNGSSSRSKLLPIRGIEKSSIGDIVETQVNEHHSASKPTITSQSVKSGHSNNKSVNNSYLSNNNQSLKTDTLCDNESVCSSSDINQIAKDSFVTTNKRSMSPQHNQPCDITSVGKGAGNEGICKSNTITSDTHDSKPIITKPKILLAEDNKVNVMVAQSMMKRLGYSLDVVSTGAEAVQAIQKQSYDLILMDVYMPVMDGLEATRLIRAYEASGNWDAAEAAGVSCCHTNCQEDQDQRKRTPIIAMTANALTEGIAECFTNGMDSFLAKPVTFKKLKEALTKYIGV